MQRDAHLDKKRTVKTNGIAVVQTDRSLEEFLKTHMLSEYFQYFESCSCYTLEELLAIWENHFVSKANDNVNGDVLKKFKFGAVQDIANLRDLEKKLTNALTLAIRGVPL